MLQPGRLCDRPDWLLRPLLTRPKPSRCCLDAQYRSEAISSDQYCQPVCAVIESMTYIEIGQGEDSWRQTPCPPPTSGFSGSNLLVGPIPASGANVSGLYATMDGTVSGKDSATVTVMDNTSGAELLSCEVTSMNKKHCSNTSGSGAAAAGDYIEVKITTSGPSAAGRRGRVMFRF
jgi:hypothetical protein